MNKKYITKYRIVNNPSYNDFNDELPYTIVAVDYDPKTDLIRQRGFNGWSKISDKLYDTRQECEKHFVFEINYELGNNAADLQHRLEVAEKALNEMANYAINDNDLYDLVSDFNIENERYDEDLLNKEFTNEYGTNEMCIRKCGIPLYEVTLIHNDKKTGKEKKCN